MSATPKDVMLDLETFATSPDAAILQIGACFFNPRTDEIGKRFYVNVNLTTSVLAGLRVDPETVKWWRGRDHDHLLSKAETLSNALIAFRKWFVDDSLELGAETFIWSHGAAFDIPILDMSYRTLGQKAPWWYQNTRDTRTLFAIAKDFGWVKDKGEPLHQALVDAVDQAGQVQSATRVVYRGV